LLTTLTPSENEATDGGGSTSVSVILAEGFSPAVAQLIDQHDDLISLRAVTRAG
jgi:hypothetical protein